MQELINCFILKVKERYSHLNICVEYNKNTNEYIIEHDNSKLQYEDKEFLVYVGKQIKEILYNNNIYNFSFGYVYKMW